MIRKVLTLTLALLAAIPVLASTDRSRVYTIDPQGKKTYWSPEGKKIGVEKVSQKGAMKKAPALALVGGDPKPLDIEIKYDEKEWRFECLVGGLRTESGSPVEFYEPISGIIEVPFGVHGLMCIFRSSSNNDFCVVAKDISHLVSGSKVVFDTSDCIHKVSYNPLGEDGESLNLSIRTEDGEVVEEGEYLYAAALTLLNNTGDNMMWDISGPYRKLVNNEGKVREEKFCDLYFNDCGSAFFMTQYIIGIPVAGHDFTVIEMPVYVGESSKEATFTELHNDPSRYQNYIQHWTRSPYSQSQFDEVEYSCKIGIDVLNTSFSSFGAGVIDNIPTEYDTETQLKVCSNDQTDTNSKLASMLLMDVLPENEGDGIGSFWWKPSDEGRQYQPLNSQGRQLVMQPYEIPAYFVENNYNSWLLTYGNPNENLAFDHSKAIGRMGNNTPIISLLPCDYHFYFTSDYMPFYYGLVGRYGEGNTAGIEFIEEEVSYKYDENNIRHDVFSYDNVLIDGEVDGEVICDCGIKKGSGMNEDYVPPVLTYLGMHDTSGNLTDRFQTGADGVIEFYAADFYYNMEWSLGDLGFPDICIKPISEVNVEYSPYGKSDYSPLPVSEIADKYYYPGWGSYYSVPLGDVNKNSSNGWFDVRITLKDETGNFQVQTISPAFKVLSASGVKDINETFDNTTPVYYNMQGVRVSSPEKGIYIEKIGNNTRKVIK